MKVFCLALFLLAVPSDTRNLAARMAVIAREAKGRVGVGVMLLETGESTYLNEGARFPMQSVYKVPIAMAVLSRVDQGRLKLNQQVFVSQKDIMPVPGHSPIREKHPRGGVRLTVRQLIRASVRDSDGSASDVLMRLAGGPKPIMQYLRRLRVTEVVVATTEKEMTTGPRVQYRNWATPRGAISLLKALHEGKGLSRKSRELLLADMTETRTGLRRIRGLLPPSARVAHKTGTDRTVDGLTRATNDVGIVTLPDGRHLLIAVFVSDSRADERTREAVIAKIAKSAWDERANVSKWLRRILAYPWRSLARISGMFLADGLLSVLTAAGVMGCAFAVLMIALLGFLLGSESGWAGLSPVNGILITAAAVGVGFAIRDIRTRWRDIYHHEYLDNHVPAVAAAWECLDTTDSAETALLRPADQPCGDMLLRSPVASSAEDAMLLRPAAGTCEPSQTTYSRKPIGFDGRAVMADQQERGPAENVRQSEEQEPITTADGAVRQLEKSSIAEQAKPSREQDREQGEVSSFGKAGGGAPEEDAADASEDPDRPAPLTRPEART